MNDHKELIARLRDATTGNLFADREAAADALEALQAEIKWITQANIEHMEARVELREEVERLKSEREEIIQRSNEIISNLASGAAKETK